MPAAFSPKPRISPLPSGRIREAPGVPVTRDAPARPSNDDTANIPRKAVICFQCGLISTVPQAAFSTRCHHCSAYISLDNIVLHKRSHKTLVQTRGDVTVKAGTDFQGITIHCHNLTLNGRVSGDFNCSGTCLIKTDQLIHNLVKTHTLIVDKRANVTFSKPCEAHNIEVFGTINGVVTAYGTVTIHKNAKILGDIKSVKLVMEEGATHFGHFTRLSPI